MKYKKINKNDVFNVLVSTNLDFMNPIGGTISVKSIAHLLETSRYQVKKYINELKKEGLIELNMVLIPCNCYEFCECDDYNPPYWGYSLTEKGRETEYYKEQKKKQNKWLYDLVE